MKRLLLICSFAVIALSGCNQLDENVVVKSPKISIKVESSVPVVAYPGTELEFCFSMKYEGGIKSAYAVVDGKKIPESECAFSDAPDSTILKFSYIPDFTYIGNTLDFAVFAEAVDGAKGYYDYPVFILSARPDIDIIIPEDAPVEFLADGSVLSFDVKIKSGSADLKEITTYRNGEVLPDMSFEVTGDDLRNITLPFSYTPVLKEIGGQTTFKIEVMDVSGNLVSSNYVVRFYKENTSMEIDEYYGITMGFQKCAGDSQFFDALTSTKFSANGVSEKCADVDWCVFYSTASGKQGAAFAAPAFSSLSSVFNDTIITGLGATSDDKVSLWEVRNETLFKPITISVETYVGVSSSAEIRSLYDGVSAEGKDNLYAQKPGSVIAFKISRTSASSAGELVKYGLIYVQAPAPTSNSGFVTFDYKIEK